jgi:polyisoprenoid-binding protein YceI
VTDSTSMTRRIEVPAAGRYRLDPFRSSVTLRTRLLGVRPMTGTMRVGTGEVVVDPASPQASVAATVNAASFHTGNGRRDDDVRSARFLDAKKYPEFTFRADSLRQAQGRWMLTGELTVRDVSQPVTLAIESVEAADRGFRARATTRIDRYAFGLTRLKGMGGRFFDIELVVAADPL